MMKKLRQVSPPIGSSAIIALFTLLCLTVFALLTLSAAIANSELSDVSARSVSNYYKAELRAEEILADIRKAVDEGRNPASVRGVETTRLKDELICIYSCPIDDAQSLEVEIIFQGDDYSIRKWKAVAFGEWLVDDDIKVWSGE